MDQEIRLACLLCWLVGVLIWLGLWLVVGLVGSVVRLMLCGDLHMRLTVLNAWPEDS